MPPSSLLWWWLPALLRWRKPGGDKTCPTKDDWGDVSKTRHLAEGICSVSQRRVGSVKMPLCQGNNMIASNASWIKRNAPSQESFCVLALLSILIAAPAFLMIRWLEPELVLPAFSILLFADAVIAAIVARMNSENVTLGYCRRVHHDGLRRDDFQRTGSSGTVFRATGRTSGYAAVGDNHQVGPPGSQQAAMSTGGKLQWFRFGGRHRIASSIGEPITHIRIAGKPRRKRGHPSGNRGSVTRV